MSRVELHISMRLLEIFLGLPRGWRVTSARNESVPSTPGPHPDRIQLAISTDDEDGGSIVRHGTYDRITAPHPARRLDAEQIWESMVVETTTGHTPEQHQRRRESDARLYAGLGITDPFQDRSDDATPTMAEALAAAEAAFAPRDASFQLAIAARQRPAPTRASAESERVPPQSPTSAEYGRSILDGLAAAEQRANAIANALVASGVSHALQDPATYGRQLPRSRPPIIDLTPPPVVSEFGEFRMLDIPEERIEELKPTADEPFEEPQQPWRAGVRPPQQFSQQAGHAAAARDQIAAARVRLSQGAVTSELLEFLANLQPSHYAEAQRVLRMGSVEEVAAAVVAARELRPVVPDVADEPISPRQLRALYGLLESCEGGAYPEARPATPRTYFSHYTPGIYNVFGQPELRDARTGIFSTTEVLSATAGVVRRQNREWTVVSLLEPGSGTPDLEVLNRVRRGEDAQAADIRCRWCNRIHHWDGVTPHCTQCGGSL